MRTKEEVIVAYLGDINPETFDVTLGGEMVKDVMQLWGNEILQELKKANPGIDTSAVDETFRNPFITTK